MLGYYLPWLLAGSSISAIGYGLLSLLAPDTPAAKWIGYQVFYGVGGGAMASGVSPYPVEAIHVTHATDSANLARVHQTYVAVQNLVPAPQIPIAMGIIIFSQNMGGAVFLVAANAIFSNSLRRQLQQRAAAINIAPDIIIGTGFRSLRDLVSGDALSAVLQAYSNSIDRVMYLGIAISIATFAFSWGLGWKDIRVEKKLIALQLSGSQTKEQSQGQVTF